MAAKQLSFGDEAREKIRRGVDTLAEAVRVTLGPRGRTVILQRDFGAPQIVNSGVLVAKAIELPDPFENMGAQLLRDPAKVTRPALQNAGSIAGLIRTTDCLIASMPATTAPHMAGAAPPEF